MRNTSVFVCVPMIDAMSSEPQFSVLLFLTLIASLLHWSRYKFNSTWHWIDRICVVSVFAYVLLLHYSTVNKTVFTAAIAFFLCGRFATNEQNKFQFHLLFRYFAFWMCNLVTSQASIAKIVLWTVLYAICIHSSHKLISFFQRHQKMNKRKRMF